MRCNLGFMGFSIALLSKMVYRLERALYKFIVIIIIKKVDLFSTTFSLGGHLPPQLHN